MASRPNPGLLRDPLNGLTLVFLSIWAAMAVFGRPIGDYGVETDFYGDFVSGARKWIDGEPQINPFRGPVYYVLLGLLEKITGDFFLAGKLISVVSAAIGLRVLGGLLRRLFNPMTGICGMLFVAANPGFAGFAFRAGTDMFFWMLFAASLAFIFPKDPSRFRPWILAGVLGGVAWLTRYNGLAVVPVAALSAMLTVRPIRRMAQVLLVFLLTWSAFMIPWAVFLWQRTGDPFWNSNYLNIAIEIYADSPSMAQQGRFMTAVGFESLGEVWAVQPTRFLATMGSNIYRHFGEDVQKLVGLLWAGLALAGALVSRRSWAAPGPLAFALGGLATYITLLPVFYNQRFMLPLLPWWAACVGALPAYLASRWDRRERSGKPRRSGGRRVGLREALVGAFVVGALFFNQKEIRQSMDPASSKTGPIDLLELARQVKQAGVRLNETTPVAARKPQFGYYTGAPTMPLPYGTVDDLRESGAHYLLVSGAEVRQFPALAPLAWLQDSTAVPEGLTLVSRHAAPVDQRSFRATSLYAVENPLPWKPPVPRDRRRTRERIPGLGRIDSLRLRLARWYLVWESSHPIEPLIRLMSTEVREHPEVLQVRGDGAIVNHDPERAKELYLLAVESDPKSETARLRLAGVHFLQEDLRSMNRVVSEYLVIRPEGAIPNWRSLGIELTTSGDLSASLAPLAACASGDTGDPTCIKLLGEALAKLGWLEHAKKVFTRYLAARPDDREVRNMLENLTRAIEQK